MGLPAMAATEVAGTSDIEAQTIPDVTVPLLTRAQWIYCWFVLVVEVYLMWFFDQVPGAKDAHMYIVVHLMLAFLFPRTKSSAKQDALQSVVPAAVEQAGVDTKVSPPHAGDAYVENVKIFRTVLETVFQITIGFGGQGGDFWSFSIGNYKDSKLAAYSGFIVMFCQSFIMCLLFFLSGISIASSFERKGTTEFIRDKLKHLGWPVVITFFVVTPILTSLVGSTLVGGDWHQYTHADTGVCWKLVTLILLSITYAIVPWSAVTLPFPSISSLVLIGALLGAFQGLASAFNYDAFYIMSMPLGALPFEIAFFAAGCIAKKSGWLDAIQKLKKREYWLARILGLTILILAEMLGKPNTAYVECGAAAAVVQGAASKFSPHVPQDLVMTLLVCSLVGIQTVALSVSVLHFFAVHLNSQGKVGKILSAGEHGVYVFHHALILLVMWSYVLILRANGYEIDFSYSQGMPMSSSFISQSLLLAGWLYTILLVNLISWPLAYFIRKLPGIKEVL